MSVSRAWRDQINGLLLGTLGSSPFVVPSGYFHAPADTDGDLKTMPVESIERAFNVSFQKRNAAGSNVLFTTGQRRLVNHTVTIEVGYLLTGQGLDFEATGQQSGAATVDSNEDRAWVDEHLIASVLNYPANWGAVTPPIIHIKSLDSDFVTHYTDRSILTMSFELIAWLTAPGSYGPALTGS